MTQTQPPNTVLRPCRLYRFYVAHPVSGERVLGYIGETWQMPFDRLMQHVRDQPWADTILGWDLDPTVYYGKTAVIEAERLAVERERPLYNYEWNLANPLRIEIWRAKQQRWARDDAAGVRRWVPPQKTPRQRPPAKPSMHSVPVRRKSITTRLTPVQVKICLWSIAWLETTLTTATALHHWQYASTWTQRWVIGSVTALLLTAWSLVGAPVTKRQWRKVRRRGWKKALRW